MDMPVITPRTTTRAQAITDIMESVALEDAALSHILNVEGKQIQRMVAMPDAAPEVLLATNKSAESMVNTVSRLEMILQSEHSIFDGCLCESSAAESPAALQLNCKGRISLWSPAFLHIEWTERIQICAKNRLIFSHRR